MSNKYNRELLNMPILVKGEHKNRKAKNNMQNLPQTFSIILHTTNMSGSAEVQQQKTMPAATLNAVRVRIPHP